MDFKRYCTICGNENFGKTPFCSEKCRQRYYYLVNKEKRQKYKKEYYQEHKEECDSRHFAWVDKNRAKWNEYNQKRREEKKDGEIN